MDGPTPMESKAAPEAEGQDGAPDSSTDDAVQKLAGELMEVIRGSAVSEETAASGAEDGKEATLEDVIAQLDEISTKFSLNVSNILDDDQGAFNNQNDPDATFASIDKSSGKHAAVELGWSSIDFHVNQGKKQILHGCEGVIRP